MFARIARLFDGLRIPGIAEAERAYLNQAVSRQDLDRRIREVDGGLFRRSLFDH